MALCAVSNLGKYYGAELVFKNMSFEIEEGQRIGLIGPNGVGKTTLLKILMEIEDYQEGSIFKRSEVRLDYLDQIPVFPHGYKTIDVLLEAFEEIRDMEKQLKSLEVAMSNSSALELEKAIKDYGVLEHSYEQRGGYAVHERLNRIVIGLNINNDMQNQDFELLSGGEKSRIILGKILLEEPNILLLDEPSNHLDLEYMSWLEGYLQDYKGAVVIVSHDRWFLNRAVNRIIEIEKQGVEIYNGNYSYYQMESKRRLEEKFKQWQSKQRQVDKLEQQIEQFIIWGRARDSEVMFKRAKELKKRLARIDMPDKPIMNSKKIRLNKNEISRSGKEVIKVNDLSKKFTDRLLFKDFNFTVYYQERVAIIGSNGSGKSTLLKIIMGDIEPTSGQTKIGSRVKIGYLPQEVEFYSNDDNLIEAFQREFNITATQTRHELARVLFTGDDVFKSVSTLSGGERSRLKLCMLMYAGSNVLILDEPTNHLDIDSREELEKTLKGFDGTIVFVSHDRYFIDAIATTVVEIKNKKIEVFLGDYKYFLEQNEKRKVIIKDQISKKSTKSKREYEDRKAIQSEWRRQDKLLDKYEARIKELEVKLKSIEQDMKVYQNDISKIQELYVEQEKAEEELINLIEEHEKLKKTIENR